MKLFKIFGSLFLLLLLLLFLIKNNDLVSVNLIFKEYTDINVSIVMLGALAVGILIGYGVAITSILAAKAEIRSLRLKNRTITEELNDLRNVAIDEGIYDIEDGDA